MKVLYIGHYREFGGWSDAAIGHMLAMDTVGIDVVARNIPLTQSPREDIPKKIEQFEGKSLEDCDVCIQHVLPHHLIGTSGFKKNIALLESESLSIKDNAWFNYLQQMDEVWVPNSDLKNILTKDGLFEDSERIKTVPHTCDLRKYKAPTKPVSIEGLDDKFKFYYIGDMNDRKNLRSLVRCFHSEFDRSEPVGLVLKLWKFGHSPQQVRELAVNMCNQVKQELRMYKSIESYHTESIISEQIPEEGIRALHQYGDCFVCPSHGEAWSIPSFDAMCYGKTPICSNFGGPKEFIGTDPDINKGTLVEGFFDVCDCTDSPFPTLFTGREQWFDPSEGGIKSAMRYYYEQRDKIDRQVGIESAERFSYESVGNLMKDYLGG